MMPTILVLEDEMPIRSFIVLNLKRAGFYVLEASTGEEALQILCEHTVDVALLDVMLREWMVFKFVKQSGKKIKIGIIMLTRAYKMKIKYKG